ncbi:MAG: glycine zipper 2TM domain-containing protein, partial [Cyanobacteriota bacterium]
APLVGWAALRLSAPRVTLPTRQLVTEAAPLARRCHLWRLVGGLIGGGVGYASSRKEGRSWAVPLGALLGSQVGCNLGAGRGPLPW